MQTGGWGGWEGGMERRAQAGMRRCSRAPAFLGRLPSPAVTVGAVYKGANRNAASLKRSDS